jgi:hypothetical protein
MMIRKGDMNTVFKSKSQLREEGADALQEFLARGGKIEVVKARKAPKQKMRAKASRGGSASTSGFAVGYVSSKIGA